METEGTQERYHTRSEEEDDILQRHIKKARAEASERGNGYQEDTTMRERDQTKEHISFREKLMGGIEESLMEEQEDWRSEDDEEEDIEEDMERDCPNIRLSKEEKQRIRRPWKRTLIIKLLGRSIGYHLLLRKIQELWRPKASVELVAIDNGFFFARFTSEEDYAFAKYEGPWMIFNHYLTVRQWSPNFDPFQDDLKNLLMWVRIPGLPIEYFDYQFLMQIGTKIGNPIKVDTATSLVSRGHYARICVEVDLAKPLVAKFRLRRRVRRLEYEGIHMVCFNCGIYGHNQSECQDGKQKDSDLPKQQVRKEPDNLMVRGNGDQHGCGIPDVNPEIVENFGPWMLASRKSQKPQTYMGPKGKKEMQEKGKNIPIQAGTSNKKEISRFSVLEVEEDGEWEENMVQRESKDEEKNSNSGKKQDEGLKRKGKRQNVQVQVVSLSRENPVVPEVQGSKMKSAVPEMGMSGEKVKKLGKDRVGPNQAAAEESHWVITSTNNNNIIRREQVFHEHHDDFPTDEETADGGLHMNEDRGGNSELMFTPQEAADYGDHLHTNSQV